MWFHDLSDMYENILNEGYGAYDPSRNSVPRIGIQSPNLAALSQAGNVQFGNPTEQEEIIDGNLSKRDLFRELSSLASKLDSASPTDRVALLMLSQLKKKFK